MLFFYHGLGTLIREVFEALGLDPAMARKRVRIRNLARGRALAAWLWVERMGGSQWTVASEFGVSPAAVTLMLNELRQAGLRKEEEKLLNKVFETAIEDDTVEDTDRETTPKSTEPKVIILKRQR